MIYSAVAGVGAFQLALIVACCLLSYSVAHPTKGHRAEIDQGGIPLALLMSELQVVNVPEYQAEPFIQSSFTGAPKRKRHGHGSQHSQETATSGSCCPTMTEIVEPTGGKSKSGFLVEVLQTDDIHQKFHEISCLPSVVEQPCRFVSATKSRCVQQYSYSYAMVRDFGSTDGSQNPGARWRMEHIRVRSGCSCIVDES